MNKQELLKKFIDASINKDAVKAKQYFHAFLKPEMKKVLKDESEKKV